MRQNSVSAAVAMAMQMQKTELQQGSGTCIKFRIRENELCGLGPQNNISVAKTFLLIQPTTNRAPVWND